MRTPTTKERRCSYVVVVQSATRSAGELRDFAHYLSTVSLAGCEVLILDPSPRLQFDLNARSLRWVGRHMPVRPQHRTPGGAIDVVRAAADLAGCEKVIVAADDVRYSAQAIGQLCELLETYEVVEPQDYLDPLPWWGGIDAGRILVHRGIEPQPDHGATFGFRRSAIRALRTLNTSDAADDPPRRLAAHGANVHPAADVFVRRQPVALGEWLAQRPRQAGEDFVLPMKTAFFFSLVPLLLLLAALGNLRIAGGYAGVIAFASIGLAVRGRTGAGAFFPFRACLFAPLWVFERAVSVYWALYRKLRGLDTTPPVTVPERGREKVASSQ